MAFSFSIDSDRGVIRFTAGSVFTSQDVVDSIEQVRADPAFRSNFDHLVDLRGVSEYQPKPDDIRKRSRFDRSDIRLDSCRMAVVASKDVVFGMSRMYEALMENADVTVRTFHDMADAKAWLGLGIEAED